jgi:aryl-phospho-beta-D-glucosidase BglC (GH1 family)/20S proteasome alpha/beta subunit
MTSGFELFGVNLAGAAFNPNGTHGIGFDYTYPTHAEIDYFASKGDTAIRLSFLWDRVQPTMDGALDAAELSRIDDVVNYANAKGIKVILDPHDFGYAYGNQVGSTALPNSAFANLWGQLAGHFASDPNVLFGLMNEPNDISATQWLGSVNAAIGAIRSAGATTQQILVPGTYWDGASSWTSTDNASVIGAGVVDPNHNFAFEVHQYLDSDGSGTHSTVVSTEIGVQRLQAITAWAEATGNKLFLGEFGVSSDPTSLTALDNMLLYMQQHNDVWEGGTYWAAGPWWGSYMYSVEPANGVDKPQMAILDQFTSHYNATVLTGVGNQVYLYAAGTTSGPALKFGGAPVVAGQLGAWVPIAAMTSGTGYEVAWKIQGTDQYTVWNVDGSGNYVSNAMGVVAGSNAALEALETTFHQDLNGDGAIGIQATTIESLGTTSLVQASPNYFLNPVGGGTGPELQFGGTAVVAGQLGGWVPIGAEAVGGGYEVAFKVQGADQYTVWNTDSSGNYTGNVIGAVSGSSSALAALETTFHQDLNGDGTIGIAATIIEAVGTSSLAEIAGNYFLNPVAGGAGPELKFGGAAVVSGQLGGWAPIGAEAVGGGYEIAFKVQGVDQYTVWNTDSSGNYTSNVIGAVAGNSSALAALETSFHQDLNGDGVIGVPTTVIEAFGATSLVQSGANDFLNPVGGGTGPDLKYGGAAIAAGNFFGWAPIGAEATGSGYEVAWKLVGTDQYTVWNTDSGGNYVGNAIGAVSASSAALQALETSFHQDLNGDGTIGIPVSTSQVNAQSAMQSSGDGSGEATFDGHTLTLATPATFDGHIVGFGNAGVDQIDLRGVDFAALNTNFDQQSGTLSLSEGATTTHLSFLGAETQSSFHFADDGNRGTLVSVAAGLAPSNQSGGNGQATAVSVTGHDTFVFAPNFGQVSISNFMPATDHLVFSTTVFASEAALFASTHDDSAGNAVISDAAHDAITLAHVTTAQLLAHQSDIHLV